MQNTEDKLQNRVARLTFCKPNFRNMASFQVSWPENTYLAFWPFLTLFEGG